MSRKEQLARALAELAEWAPCVLSWVEVVDEPTERLKRAIADAEELLTPEERNQARPWSPPQLSSTSS